MAKVLRYPAKKLLIPSEVVGMDRALKIVEQLRETMAEQSWGKTAGMAAPQIGINKRVFIALDEAYINPVVTELKKGGKRFCNEGCYSLETNKFDYKVLRSHAVNIVWTDEQGQSHNKNFSGFKAQVIQHEYDHLEGRLCNGQ